MKNLIKKIYYLFNHIPLNESYKFNLAFMFHTEDIQNLSTFKKLMQFSKAYHTLTDSRPIATVMTAINARIADKMKENSCSEFDYGQRLIELETVADIGYHGHFYKDKACYDIIDSEIKKENHSTKHVEEQFLADLQWFSNQKFTFYKIYAAGWWYTSEHLIKLLIENEFKYDFSFTYSPHFGHDYSKHLMATHNIATGEAFHIKHKTKSIGQIQNLIGCHNTPFPQDFNRNLNKIISTSKKEIIGVINTHDYNLQTDLDYTINCIKNLSKMNNVSFWSLREANLFFNQLEPAKVINI